MRPPTIRRFAGMGVLVASCSTDAQLGTEPVHHVAPTVASADAAVSGTTDGGTTAPPAATGGAAVCTGNECGTSGGAGGCAGRACNEDGGAVGSGGTGNGGTKGRGGSHTGGAESGGAIADAASPTRDAGACRPDHCPGSLNCCASDGTCGNTAGEGCVSTGQRPRPCKAAVNVITITANGTYAPANVAAIWVQTSAGKFVKTLLVDGTIRSNNLVDWGTVSMANKVDAITGATRLSHGPLAATWDCTDTSEAEVPDGSYSVCVTFAEGTCIDHPNCFFTPMDCLVIEKGPAAATFHGQDTSNFSSFVVNYR